jgi:hypothetical protein
MDAFWDRRFTPAARELTLEEYYHPLECIRTTLCG